MVNTNPFSSDTTGGAAGQFVFDELNKNQNSQYEATSLSRAAKYEAEAQQKYDNYIVVMEALDQDILNKLQIINNKKQEIVDIIDGVFVNYSETDPLVESIESISDSVAEKVVYMAGISTFTYGSPFGIPPKTPVGVRGEVFPDIFVAWHYPNLESMNVNVNLYKEGEDYVSIASTLGIGVTAYEYGDAAGTTGFVGLVTTSNSSLGYYYFWPDLSSVDVGAATSISNIVDEIEILRVGINSSLNDAQEGTNKIRNLKTKAQEDLWFEKKGQQSIAPLNDYQGGIDSLQENATIIQNYNA